MARRPRNAPAADRARPAPARRRRRRGGKPGLPLWRVFAALFVIGALAVAALLISVARDLPDTSSLAAVERSSTIAFLDHRGRLIARRGSAHGHEVAVADLPPYLVDAVLAVEDRRFYSHPGVDVIGLSRAMLANIRAGHIVQGGSTLTQQLAKNLFLSPERTWRRKLQEMMLAFWLESRFTKDEILELYLNRVYFGGGAYGIEAASLRYFGKPASEVSLGEAALLAGLLKAPSRYSPVNDASRAAARATVVLDLMMQTGRITEAERVAAASTPIRVSRGASSPDAQRAAEAALEGVLADPARAAGVSEGALVSLAHDGSVRAMVGGRSYVRSQFNRAILASRQPGSAFKAFVYASAFEAGLSPDDVRDDRPVRVGDWAPQNYNDTYRGEMTLQEAFARSSNSIAVQIAEETGRGHVARLTRRLGMESPMRADRSLALGAYEVTPLELAGAYTPFANGGYRVSPFGILSIETEAGDLVFETPPPADRRVLDARTVARMQDLLRAVVVWGTGRNAAVPGLETGGKTGTTNDFRDAWFAGYGADVVTAIWTGNDDNAPTDHATGGGPPALIFSAYMQSAPHSGLASGHSRPADEGLAIAPPGEAETVATPAEREEPRDPIAAFLAGLGGPDSE